MRDKSNKLANYISYQILKSLSLSTKITDVDENWYTEHMRLFFAFLVVLLLSGFFLNRSYAKIYQKLDEAHLTSPSSVEQYLIGESTSTLSRITYVAIGDSLTAGVGVTSSTDTFPYLLSKKWATSGKNIELLNLAVPGARSQDVIDSQLQKTIDTDPDIVTVLIGINDIQGFVSADTFKQNEEKIINELTSRTDAKIILVNIPYLGTDDLIPWPYNWIYHIRTREFNDIIKNIAQKKNLILVDLYTATKEQSTRHSEYYSVDQLHPSAKGYKQWSDIIYANTNF